MTPSPRGTPPPSDVSPTPERVKPLPGDAPMIGYLSDEGDWSKMLDGATTLSLLREGVRAWAPFVDDAQRTVDAMDAAALVAFHAGLKKERRGKWAGEAWTQRFGDVLMPANLLVGSEAAERYKVPLGTALIRMQKAGVLRKPPAARETEGAP